VKKQGRVRAREGGIPLARSVRAGFPIRSEAPLLLAFRNERKQEPTVGHKRLRRRSNVEAATHQWGRTFLSGATGFGWTESGPSPRR